MRIAVDAGFFYTNNIKHNFLKEVFYRLAKQQANHQFIFLLQKPITDFPENVTPVVISPVPTNFILNKFWYDFKVPLAIKKYKADVFICANGMCSLTTRIPQLLFIQSLTFLKYPTFSDRSRLSFYKKYTSFFIKKAIAVVAFSDYTKKEIINKYATPEQKITVIGIAADSAFKALTWEEREKVKEQFAASCEYFVFTGGFSPAENLISLLKAFSIFKKWLKSNMKLIITVNSTANKAQLEKLNSYKYKKEILLAENLSNRDLAKVTAGAYAMIFPALYEEIGLPVLEALQCEVLVITSADSNMSEIAGEAGLYVNPENPEIIAEQMKRIFKDEQLRNRLSAAGKQRAEMYNWDKTLAAVWKLIQQTVSR